MPYLAARRLAADLVEGEGEPLDRGRCGDALGDDRVASGGPELGLQIRLPVDAFARNPLIEEIGPPVDLDGDLGHERDRHFQAAFADIAPRTDDIGNDVNVHRGNVGLGHEARLRFLAVSLAQFPGPAVPPASAKGGDRSLPPQPRLNFRWRRGRAKEA